MAAKKSKRANEKLTTSKQIIIASWTAAVILTAVVVTGSFIGCDMTAVSVIATSAWVEVSAANGFYFWKAKKENVMKIAVGSVKDTPELADKFAAVISALGGVA
ncbi:MAG: hypothetical protein HDT43_11930 [Ruminococcaceae bacterium]|nr:hypothetical protein [Oscillospiraceae bacterium]